jgi:hypothetical protein
MLWCVALVASPGGLLLVSALVLVVVFWPRVFGVVLEAENCNGMLVSVGVDPLWLRLGALRCGAAAHTIAPRSKSCDHKLLSRCTMIAHKFLLKYFVFK